MKILVTGGAGFIGSHVVDLFIQRGYEVVILDDLSTGRISNINPLAKFYQMDIRSDHVLDVFQQERPDYVSHHAAQMNVRVSVANPLFDAEVNILGTLKLLEWSRLFGVKHFIHISSSAVYGEPIYLPVDELHPINPVCQYGVSKHTAEHYLYLYEKNYNIPYTVFRYPNVYGPRQDPHGEAGVIAQFTNKMLSGEPITINGDGEQTRDFVYVRDIAFANLLAVEVPHKSGIYNLGSGIGTSVNKVFQFISIWSNYQHIPNYAAPILGETQRIYLDATKAENELKWYRTMKVESGLNRTLEYFKEQEFTKERS